MNFGFTPEQQILRAEIRRFLAEHAPVAESRHVMETPGGYSEALWQEMAKLGWLGLALPEVQGGAGLGWIDLVVLLEETGRALLPSPLLASSLAGMAVAEFGDDAQKSRWLPDLAAGRTIFAPALLERGDRLGPEGVRLRAEASGEGFRLRGEKSFVLDACAASHFVVACHRAGSNESADSNESDAELGLCVVPASAAGVSVTAWPTLDASKRLGQIEFRDVEFDADAWLARARGPAAFERVLDQLTAAVTAEAIGAVEAAHALVVEYAKQRVQFGSPIGRFQGVKHPLAEMYGDIESLKSILYYATWCLEQSPREAPRYVSMAKAWVSDVFTRVGMQGVELHGAIGTTWECDAQLYLKRSKWVKTTLGGSDHHYERVARERARERASGASSGRGGQRGAF